MSCSTRRPTGCSSWSRSSCWRCATSSRGGSSSCSWHGRCCSASCWPCWSPRRRPAAGPLRRQGRHVRPAVRLPAAPARLVGGPVGIGRRRRRLGVRLVGDRAVLARRRALRAPGRGGARAAPVTAPRRPDASMSLLNDVIRPPVDGDYAASTPPARPAAAAPAAPRGPGCALVVALLLGLVLSGAVVSLRAPTAAVQARAAPHRPDPGADRRGRHAVAPTSGRSAPRSPSSRPTPSPPATPRCSPSWTSYELVSGAAAACRARPRGRAHRRAQDAHDRTPRAASRTWTCRCRQRAVGGGRGGHRGERAAADGAERDPQRRAGRSWWTSRRSPPRTASRRSATRAPCRPPSPGSAVDHLALLSSYVRHLGRAPAATHLVLPGAGDTALRYAHVLPDVASSARRGAGGHAMIAVIGLLIGALAGIFLEPTVPAVAPAVPADRGRRGARRAVRRPARAPRRHLRRPGLPRLVPVQRRRRRAHRVPRRPARRRHAALHGRRGRARHPDLLQRRRDPSAPVQGVTWTTAHADARGPQRPADAATGAPGAWRTLGRALRPARHAASSRRAAVRPARVRPRRPGAADPRGRSRRPAPGRARPAPRRGHPAQRQPPGPGGSLRAQRAELVTGADTQRAAREAAAQRAQVQGILAGRLPAEGPACGSRSRERAAGRPRASCSRPRGAAQRRRRGGPAERPPADRLQLLPRHPDGVEVDGVVLTRPYLWLAIGDPDTIIPALEMPGGALAAVRRRRRDDRGHRPWTTWSSTRCASCHPSSRPRHRPRRPPTRRADAPTLTRPLRSA